LRELLAELAALHPDRDEYDAPNYNHDAPMFAFKELSRKIRGLLRGAVAPSFEKIDFARQADAYTATLTPDHFTKPNDYFLAIETKSDPRALIALVEDPDRFKVLASSYATRAIRGLKLKEERTPPLELPAKNTLFYFRILRQESGRMWDALKTERSAVIRLSGVEACDFSISLYMTIPS
jgi:predicted component of type VI protein secretion system